MGPMFFLIRRRMYEEARSRIEHPPPEFEVEFADDAYSGGYMTDRCLGRFQARNRSFF